MSESVRTLPFRGRRSRNKVSVGEPAEGSLAPIYVRAGFALGTAARPPRSRVPRTERNETKPKPKPKGRSSPREGGTVSGPLLPERRASATRVASHPPGAPRRERESYRLVREEGGDAGRPRSAPPRGKTGTLATASGDRRRRLDRTPRSGPRLRSKKGGLRFDPPDGGAEAREREKKTTLYDGHLGSPDDEGRSEVR